MIRLSASDITVKFGNTTALEGVSFEVAEKEVLALIGENGAGKSTLMKVLSGAVIPNNGSMSLNAKPYMPRDPHDARSLGVAMVYQELSLAPSLNAQENVFLGMELSRGPVLNHAEMRVRAADALKELGHDIPLNVPVRSLSISDQQLIELARAVAVGCSVLILDEPTSSITKQDVDRLFSLIRRLKERGLSIIYISHFLEEVKEIADRFVVLRDGRTAGGGAISDHSVEQIVGMMVGRTLSDLYPKTAHNRGDAVLEVDNLASVTRLKTASLTLHRGEILGIFGLVGSGRTELLRAIFGLDSVREGKVCVAVSGPMQELMRLRPDHLWKRQIGLVSEDRKSEGLALNRSIAENLILSGPHKLERNGVLSPAAVDRTTVSWIDQLTIKCRGPRQAISELSGGNQQKVAIGRLLHHDVDVLLLDEPTRGIDVGSKRQIYELIDRLAGKNKAIVMISSYLPELLGMCDRIAVMSRGVLGSPREVSEINEESIMLEATAAGTGE